jgi:signal transduction histidine kinase
MLISRTRAWSSEGPAWLVAYAAARLVATLFAAALVVWSGADAGELLMVLYGAVSTAVLVGSPSLRRQPAVWAADAVATLVFVFASGDWRSPFYLMWLSSLVLPAVSLRLREAAAVAVAAPLGFLLVAIVGGPAPGSLALQSTETLAIHLALPFLLVCALAYAAMTLRRLSRERLERERLAIEAERRRIAWELHDSAKQRLHAAHLMVTSLQGRVPSELDAIVGRAVIELESASSDMDTSLAELRSPLEGRPLAEALRARARELATVGSADVTVRGDAPPLPPLVGAHVFRIAGEALTNALRHADADTIDVTLEPLATGLRVRVADDGHGLPPQPRPETTGLLAMENRAATIGATLQIDPRPAGRGTVVQLDVPLDHNGGTP